MIRWILFDAVGTLIQVHPNVVEIYQRAASRFGVVLPERLLGERFQLAYAAAFADSSAPTSEADQAARWRQVVKNCFPEISDQAIQKSLFDQLWDIFAKPATWRLESGLDETLSRLKRSGVRLGIASNFDQRLSKIIGTVPALRHIDRVLCSAGIGWSKPNPKFYHTIERQLGAAPNEILIVGDSYVSDFEAPKQFQWNAILYDPSNEHPEAESRIAMLSQLGSVLFSCGCGPRLKQ